MDFLWHKVSEKEKEDIKNQAKAIMDSFSKKLERINKKTEEPIIEREKGERQETQGKESDEFFKKSILDNFRIKDSDSARESEKEQQDSRHAPEKSKDFIIAERKGW
ncbi:MAG: hypothetical protein Q7K54_05260 [Candidatus Parcubacteria bacterium]|nr:hypothetical protein [Candidatus Parcubacteria bacterium]